MEIGRRPVTIERVRDPDRIRRYALVPRASPNGKPDGVRRFSLARIGTTPRSAVGGDRLDRLERMERIVDAEREQEARAEDADAPGQDSRS
jgi:hypothetical protein